jgi:hypothetical protein
MKEVKNLQELINREQAGKNICKYCASTAYCKEDDCMVYRGLRDTPTIQIEPKCGEWVIKRNEFYTSYNMYYAECSNCKHTESTGMVDRLKYCPNCGAKMDNHVADVSKKVGIDDDN